MRRLLERLVGRPSSDERKPDAVAQAVPAAQERGESIGSAGADVLVGSRESVIQALRRRVAEGSGGRLGLHEIHEDAPLFDRGYLDSFSYVEFLVFIERAYRVRIDDSQLAGHLSTIAAMAEHILRAQTPRPE